MNDNDTPRTATVETPGEREIKVERVFDAPRDVVFEAMTNPELIPEWWGPREHRVTVDVMDVERGGSWRFVAQDGVGFRGTYREVSPPERIVQTFEWEGMPGHISVETSELIEQGDQTLLRVSSIFHTGEERDGMVASGMEGGLQETYQRLDEVLAARAA